jgi:hypothetical protein
MTKTSRCSWAAASAPRKQLVSVIHDGPRGETRGAHKFFYCSVRFSVGYPLSTQSTFRFSGTTIAFTRE